MRIVLCTILCLAGCNTALFAVEPTTKISAEQEKFFEAKIRPVLANSCYECHSAKKQQFGLRLDSRDALMKGGDSGSVLTPGKVDESRLWKVLQHDPLDTQMPPKSKLSDATLADIRTWIEMGAPWPEVNTPHAKIEASVDWKKHWAYQPISRPATPTTVNQDWPLTTIDRFVLTKLEAAGLPPSMEADRPTLLRRLKYDLLGLPPTFAEIQQFEQNPSTAAYEELVEEFLSSPHFGERWARHWLDISRYADTKGYVFTEDRTYPDAWKYREWLINAFNGDMPYDRFLMLQLAADQLSDDPENWHAMGFLTLGRRFLNNKHDIIDDQIDVMTRGMMGLTVTCARCHDHKYDPIPSADYYSLYGVFDSSTQPNDALSKLRLVDKPEPVEPVVFLRGRAGNNGPRVPRQFLEVIERDHRKPFTHGSGRVELAQSITSRQNPLTGRVWANRVWGHLTGKELVNTPSDFGVRSDPPTHPELLDHLAVLLIDNGWSTKQLIRDIVLSRTYRQRSIASDEVANRDPNNELVSHMNRRRVDFEGLRDGILAVSGQLDSRVGGESVEITSPPFSTRRALYAFIDRQNLPGLFRAFDFAGPDTHAPKRYQTDVPQQALFLMNSPFVQEQAEQLIAGIKASDVAERIEELYERTLARKPTESEVQNIAKYVAASVAASEPQDENRWSYGYGELDVNSGSLKSFTLLPHFTGQAWQGGGKLPDDTLGWVTLNENGGHVGNDLNHVAVRRWTAPHAGQISIRGGLKHGTKEGDGVRGRIIVNSTRQIEVWDVHNRRTVTRVDKIAVEAGQTVDFVCDLKQTLAHDSFEWPVVLTLDSGEQGGSEEFDSSKQFRGPRPRPLDEWEQVAQILLLSNEFQFVD